MQTLTAAALFSLASLIGCASSSTAQPAVAAPEKPRAISPPGDPLMAVTDEGSHKRPPFAFSAEDETLLTEVQHGAFLFFWNCVEQPTGMVRDRSSKPIVSVAGVGFQLAAICVGIERGWITRQQGEERTLTILRALQANPKNRKAGVFFHYLDGRDAGPSHEGYEAVASTIDAALLFSGMIVAGEYFDGESAKIANELVGGADWSFYVARGDRFKPSEQGFISLAWTPKNPKADPTGEGELAPYVWMDAGDEQRLVNFLATATTDESRRVDPATYYRLRRRLGSDLGNPPFVWFPWSGAMFTHFFAHCFIDFAHMGPDNPAALNVEHRSRVDWWVNALRATQMHQRKHLNGEPNAWGLTASDSPDGYSVPGLFPSPLPTSGLKPDFDFHPGAAPKDNHSGGAIAPYGAGCTIMFDPESAVRALRYYRGLKDAAGAPLLWRDPSTGPGNYGFLDSYAPKQGSISWVATDYVAIDQGPLILSIENARTGLAWRLFHESAFAKAAMSRLKLERRTEKP